MNSLTNSHHDSTDFARAALSGMSGARATVVNRTHRVVRERARVLQEKRSRDRSLMIPLLVCSSLLILTALALWTGLYQYQASETVEAVQSDVAALTDINNHFMVVLLWFVPVSIAFMVTLWVRRTRNNHDDEAH